MTPFGKNNISATIKPEHSCMDGEEAAPPLPQCEKYGSANHRSKLAAQTQPEP
jgi:hypothetical protein